MNVRISPLTLLTAALCVATIAAQDKRGDVTLTFKYGGSAVAPMKITPTKDPEFCGKNPDLVDDSLLVNQDNQGIANIVVSIYVKPGGQAPTGTAAQLAAHKEAITMDNRGCMFSPHVAFALTGQVVKLKNSDSVGHNTKIDCFKNPALNPIIPAGSEQEEVFKAEESLPVKVGCNIHPWMAAWLVVKEHPFVAISDANGKVTLQDVPEGKWTLQVWQEKSGYVDEVMLKGKKESWKRGRFDITVKAGETLDVGEATVPAASFMKN